MDADIIIKAIKFGQLKHLNQKDSDGWDYFNTHCLQVFNILKEVTLDTDVLTAGLLHDTLEDTETTYEELVTTFGKKVADLVREVTHEGNADNVGFYFPYLTSKEGIMIKFADRLSNLTRMSSWSIKRQEHYLRKSKFWKSKKDGTE